MGRSVTFDPNWAILDATSVLPFGTIVGMDYEPELRAMILTLNLRLTVQSSPPRATFDAVVLTDTVWPVGTIVTLAPAMAGFRIYEEGDR